MITNTALPVLSNECILTDKFNRSYSDEFARKDAKIGATVNVRRPPRYFGTFGPALNVEPSVETYVPVSLNYQFHVDVQFNTVNMLLDISEFKTRFIKPACEAVANRIDSDGAYFAYQNTPLTGGVWGTAPTSYKTFSDANAVMRSEGAPKGQTPVAVMHPLAMSSMADSLKGLFNPQQSLSDNYETGVVALKTAGFDWFEDQNIPVLTTGAYGASTPVLAGATSATGGTALLTSGWAQNGTFETTGWASATPVVTVGDIFQVKGVYPVNPQNRGQYGTALKQFVVLPPGGYAPMSGAAIAGGPQFAAATLANGTFNATTGVYTSKSGGALTLTVSECLISGGQFQNCTAAPVSPYTITVNGNSSSTVNSVASTANLAFYRDAYALAFADLPLPRTAVEASRAYDEELGLSIRIATQYTINNDAEPTRMDVLYGFSSLYRQLGYRVQG
ncbi:MAG TPA: P22 phage major capsid protein family protein [Candidatus Saccharimonadia bacterium]|nr:P22 phage major capsid protein family protein [Candidatus Saccharimonadia bacterium]